MKDIQRVVGCPSAGTSIFLTSVPVQDVSVTWAGSHEDGKEKNDVSAPLQSHWATVNFLSELIFVPPVTAGEQRTSTRLGAESHGGTKHSIQRPLSPRSSSWVSVAMCCLCAPILVCSALPPSKPYSFFQKNDLYLIVEFILSLGIKHVL